MKMTSWLILIHHYTTLHLLIRVPLNHKMVKCPKSVLLLYYIRTSLHQYSVILINKISLHPVSWQYLSILLEYTPTVHYIPVLVI